MSSASYWVPQIFFLCKLIMTKKRRIKKKGKASKEVLSTGSVYLLSTKPKAKIGVIQRRSGNYHKLKRKLSRFISDLLILLKLSLLFLLYFFHPFKIFLLYVIMDVKVQELKISNFYKQAFLRRRTLGVLHTSGNARVFGGTILETTGAYEGNKKNTKT